MTAVPIGRLVWKLTPCRSFSSHAALRRSCAETSRPPSGTLISNDESQPAVRPNAYLLSSLGYPEKGRMFRGH
jgi:hypothetical protein